MIEALIFDLDETLVNNAPLIIQSQESVLVRHGIKNPHIPSSITKTFFGKKSQDIAREVIAYFSLPLKPEQLVREQDEIFLRLLDHIQTMPGFQKLIAYLRACPYKLALASSARRKPLEKKVKITGIQDLFSVMVSGDDIKKGKPNPEIFLICAKKLGVSPENCVVIEDADNGIIAAKRAGMKTIGVKNSVFDSQQDLVGADVVVDNLAEIEKVVHSLK